MALHSNESLKSFFDEMGTKVIAIGLNNGKDISVNYSSPLSPKTAEFKYRTVEGTDMFGVPHNDMTNNIPFTTWHTTDFVEYITTVDENDIMDASKAFVDPRVFH